ncbi:hypothetical protein [Enterobacter sichuanensis]
MRLFGKQEMAGSRLVGVVLATGEKGDDPVTSANAAAVGVKVAA